MSSPVPETNPSVIVSDITSSPPDTYVGIGGSSVPDRNTETGKSWTNKAAEFVVKKVAPGLTDSLQQHPPLVHHPIPRPDPVVTSPGVPTTQRIMDITPLQPRKVLPEHYIRPALSFGTKNSLSTEEHSQLAQLRKDTKGSSSLEASLRFLNSFALQHPHLSEKALMDSLQAVLPLSTLQDLEYLRMRSDPNLDEIFEYLQMSFGTARSQEEVYLALAELTDSVGQTDPISVLEQISRLLLSVTGNSKECESAAKRHSMMYLKKLLGIDSFTSLKVLVGSGSFPDLVRICKTDMKEVICTKHREFMGSKDNNKKLRQLALEHDSVEVPTYQVLSTAQSASSPNVSVASSSSSPLDSLTPSAILHQVLANLEGIPTDAMCYGCKSRGHFRRDCPTHPYTGPPLNSSKSKSKSKRFGPSLNTQNTQNFIPGPYNSQLCLVHPNSKHINRVCKAQMFVQCPVHGAAHSAAECDRYISSPSQTSGQPVPLQQPQQQQHLQNPPYQQQNFAQFPQVFSQPQVMFQQQQHQPPQLQLQHQATPVTTQQLPQQQRHPLLHQVSQTYPQQQPQIQHVQQPWNTSSSAPIFQQHVAQNPAPAAVPQQQPGSTSSEFREKITDAVLSFLTTR